MHFFYYPFDVIDTSDNSRVVCSCKDLFLINLNTPNMVLGDVVLHVGIALVNISHPAIEPTIQHLFFIGSGTVRVHHRRIAKVGVGIFRPLVYPAFHRQILYNPAFGTGVVVHQVFHHLHAHFVGFGNKGFISMQFY